MHLSNKIIPKDILNTLSVFGITAAMTVSTVITPLGFFIS